MPTLTNADGPVGIFDAHFDGYPDLVIPFADGGAGPNSADNFYLFNPQRHQFELNQQLSDLTQVGFHSNGTISSAARGSCCQHSAATYRFYGKKLVLITD